jgi:ATP-binding cassette subfamily C (CFTR/MRP) protein 4
VYVLDDVLSAVDAHVGQSLFFGCILETLRDRNKAVVLATHQLQYLKHADKILVMSKTGQQLFFGSYEEFSSRADEFSDILSAMKLEGSSEGIDDESKEENLDQALPVQAPHQGNAECY